MPAKYSSTYHDSFVLVIISLSLGLPIGLMVAEISYTNKRDYYVIKMINGDTKDVS